MEGMVNNAIINHLTDKNLLPNYKHGFRKGRSIDTNLLHAYNYITKFIVEEIKVDFST